MSVHEVQGVRFEWSVLPHPEECMNVARVLVEDACHSVVGELRICLIDRGEETRWEWRLQIEDGHRVEPGQRGTKFGADLKEFMQNAMQGAAAEMNKELQSRQQSTREMLAKQDRQRRFSQMVSDVLADL